MRIAIVGSRNFPDLKRVRDWIVANVESGDTIVSGGARGVDEAAATIGRDIGVRVLMIPPPSEKRFPHTSYGQRCAMRNRWIVDECDRLVAFWDGDSRGTAMTIGFAREAGKPVEVIAP